jgi:hypothetical protein
MPESKGFYSNKITYALLEIMGVCGTRGKAAKNVP